YSCRRNTALSSGRPAPPPPPCHASASRPPTSADGHAGPACRSPLPCSLAGDRVERCRRARGCMSEPGGKRQYLRRLECLRGAAAGYVFLHHYAHVVLEPYDRALTKPFKLGQFAVLVFFVISGFVIYYSTFSRSDAPRFRAYFIRRFRRIYPPFLVVLGITWIAQCMIEGTLADPRWRELVGNVV